ncbi:MAG: 30S ribosomal protein S8 [Deltaproteobacteria bacterium]|nr:30S ribosomal protein S8 [Deltaproteobacteria bacterium]
MITTDPIADLLTRIRNGQSAGHDVVVVPASKMKIAVVHLLKQEGFVRAYKCVRDDKQGLIKIALKYKEGAVRKGVIENLRRVSRPGRRYYVGAEKIPYVKNGFGIGILSTSRGILTCREARKLNVGGEYLCSIY